MTQQANPPAGGNQPFNFWKETWLSFKEGISFIFRIIGKFVSLVFGWIKHSFGRPFGFGSRSEQIDSGPPHDTGDITKQDFLHIQRENGLYLGVVGVGIARIVLSCAIALVITIPLWIFAPFVTFNIALIVAILIVLAFGWSDTNLKIPETTVAILTFFGVRIKVYLLEGDYRWIGRYLRFDLSLTPKKQGTDDEGYLLRQGFQIDIWNSKEVDADGFGNPLIAAQASNGALVFSTLLLDCYLQDHYQWISNEQPVVSLAERAREAFRGAINHFTDADCLQLKHRLGQMMEGYTVLAIKLPRDAGEKRPYSIVTDTSGDLICKAIKPQAPDESDDEYAKRLQEAKDLLLDRFTNHAEPKDKAVLERQGITPFVKEVRVEKDIRKIADALGIVVTNASISDLQNSEQVVAAAAAASSEVEQRIAQLASSAAIAVAAEDLGNAMRQNGKLALVLAASADDNPNAKAIVVEGEGGDLAKAAATHATLSDNGPQNVPAPQSAPITRKRRRKEGDDS